MVTNKRRKWLMFESEQETRVTKEEWKPEFNRLRKKSRRLAQKHGECIFRVAELLMQHETLTDDQIPQLEVTRG